MLLPRIRDRAVHVARSLTRIGLLSSVALTVGACGDTVGPSSSHGPSEMASGASRTPDPSAALGHGDDLPLRDVDWVLTTLASPEGSVQAVDETATLRLGTSGTIVGSTGCRTFNGHFIDVEGGISLRDLNIAPVDCPASVSRQDAFVVAILQDGLAIAIDGHRLTITSPGGQQLVYTAR